MLEGYDLHVARRLVSGVDVWLNNPVFPLEASGTSGMKAGINGVINLSVLDGWWDEGYERRQRLGDQPPQRQISMPRAATSRNARSLYELLQDQVIPLYYARGEGGYSAEWVRMAKQLDRDAAAALQRDAHGRRVHPQAVSARRQPGQPVRANRPQRRRAGRMENARERRVAERDDQQARRLGSAHRVRRKDAARGHGEARRTPAGGCAGRVPARAAAQNDADPREQRLAFTPAGAPENDVQRYVLEVAPEFCGSLDYFVRVYPWHELLAHRFELGLMRWA